MGKGQQIWKNWTKWVKRVKNVKKEKIVPPRCPAAPAPRPAPSRARRCPFRPIFARSSPHDIINDLSNCTPRFHNFLTFFHSLFLPILTYKYPLLFTSKHTSKHILFSLSFSIFLDFLVFLVFLVFLSF